MAVEDGKVASDPEVETAHSLIPLKLFRFQHLRSVKLNLHINLVYFSMNRGMVATTDSLAMGEM